MTPSDFRHSLARNEPPDRLLPALEALWWAGKDDWNAAHQIVPTAKALTAPGFALTCTALRAISTMPVIGIGRHAARRQPVILRRNGQESSRLCWPPSATDPSLRSNSIRQGAANARPAGSGVRVGLQKGFDTRDLEEAKALLEELAA
jgi:hypothetical protein